MLKLTKDGILIISNLKGEEWYATIQLNIW